MRVSGHPQVRGENALSLLSMCQRELNLPTGFGMWRSLSSHPLLSPSPTLQGVS